MLHCDMLNNKAWHNDPDIEIPAQFAFRPYIALWVASLAEIVDWTVGR